MTCYFPPRAEASPEVNKQVHIQQTPNTPFTGSDTNVGTEEQKYICGNNQGEETANTHQAPPRATWRIPVTTNVRQSSSTHCVSVQLHREGQ